MSDSHVPANITPRRKAVPSSISGESELNTPSPPGSAAKNPIVIHDPSTEPSSSSDNDSTVRISPEISHNLPDTPRAIRKFLNQPRKRAGFGIFTIDCGCERIK
ncbi:hypothetical protein DTO271D3_8370 [Paecilomyces variotii]|nr:hypothetical protein DTO271D3_8370 [Paecilomyces variotii]KAJ9361502.1 hypothetical protein DTO027B9_663 [Paecilomyces variotii]